MLLTRTEKLLAPLKPQHCVVFELKFLLSSKTRGGVFSSGALTKEEHSEQRPLTAILDLDDAGCEFCPNLMKQHLFLGIDYFNPDKSD